MKESKAFAVVHRELGGFIGAGTGKHFVFWTRQDAVAEQQHLNKFHGDNKFKVVPCTVAMSQK